MQNVKLWAFVSYSHKDEPLRASLDAHLSGLVSQGVIELWHDRAIEAGLEWEIEIQERLEAADIVLLLVSSDFLASPYCYGREMQRALERHDQGLARVVPVILRPVDWHHTPFGKLQALPKDGRPITAWQNQDEAFANVALGLRLLSKSILSDRENGLASSSTNFQEAPHQTNHPGDPLSRSVGVKITHVSGETISVTVRVFSLGTHVHCEIPLDATVQSIIVELNASLHLPRIQIDGESVQWDLISKFLGQVLDPRKTVRENNVPDGDTLTFERMCMAG